jgi:hypothetical protein
VGPNDIESDVGSGDADHKFIHFFSYFLAGAMHAAIEQVSKAGIVTSHPVPNIQGELYSTESLNSRSGGFYS